ncbi:hypothetical protein Sjap_002144 [Stephania japonica]|uniref:Uncharacterized protein n=1 Tax=Stephania japonica TaxID=461633 RepID=A0AAP0KNM6_9MAGN
MFSALLKQLVALLSTQLSDRRSSIVKQAYLHRGVNYPFMHPSSGPGYNSDKCNTSQLKICGCYTSIRRCLASPSLPRVSIVCFKRFLILVVMLKRGFCRGVFVFFGIVVVVVLRHLLGEDRAAGDCSCERLRARILIDSWPRLRVLLGGHWRRVLRNLLGEDIAARDCCGKTIHDYMLEESVCLLLRANWFESLRVVAREEVTDEHEEYYPCEEDEDDCMDDFYFSGASSLCIGNRRWGSNGYVRTGRREARPVSREGYQDPDRAGSSCSTPNKKKVVKVGNGRRAKRAMRREAADKAAATAATAITAANAAATVTAAKG